MIFETEHGFLVPTDVSSWNLYFEGAELEHAHEILTDLLAKEY